MSTRYQVRATPTGPGTFSIECSECGPVGVASTDDTDAYCLEHLEAHGVDTTPYRT